jgi:6-phosphofructokinase
VPFRSTPTGLETLAECLLNGGTRLFDLCLSRNCEPSRTAILAFMGRRAGWHVVEAYLHALATTVIDAENVIALALLRLTALSPLAAAAQRGTKTISPGSLIACRLTHNVIYFS